MVISFILSYGINMQVLMIGSDLDRGGIGSVIMTLYRSLIKHGVKCDLTYYQGAKPNDEIVKEIVSNGSRVYELKSVKQAGFNYIFQIYKLCKKEKYDVIHIHTSLLIWMAAMGAKFAGVKTRVGHAHGAKFLNYPEIVLKILEPIGRRLNNMFCTDFVTCAQDSAIYTFGFKSIFVPNYISKSEILCVSENEIKKVYLELVGNKKYDFILGYTGCLDGVKNAIFLLDVVKELRRNGSNPLLLLIGNTKQKELFKIRIKEFGIEENVKLLGFRKDCRTIIQICDYYISASKTEGMSMSMIEAQMAGIPCLVSSLIPSNSDLTINLFHKIKGFDANCWANEISELINKNYTKINREDAIQLLEKTPFCEEKVIDKLIYIYEHAE